MAKTSFNQAMAEENARRLQQARDLILGLTPAQRALFDDAVYGRDGWRLPRGNAPLFQLGVTRTAGGSALTPLGRTMLTILNQEGA